MLVLLLALAGGGGYVAARYSGLIPAAGTGTAPAEPTPDQPAAPEPPATPEPPAAPGDPDQDPDQDPDPDPDGAGPQGTDGGAGLPGPGLPGPGQAAPGGCPFTAAQISSMIGQPMVDSGNCLFGDGKGVAQLGVDVHSAAATEATLDYSRSTANNRYLLVEDLRNGDKGYIAYKNTSAEAVAITARGGYTITMSSFERFDGFQYEEPLLTMIKALPR